MPVAEPEMPQANGAAYRAFRRLSSASGIYAERHIQAPREIYVDAKYAGLESYAGKTRDPLDRRASESTEAWRRRVVAVGRALDQDELAARLAKIDEADEQERLKDHDQLRAQLGARTTGEGIGVMGLSPGQRAAALDMRRSGDPRIPASVSQVRAAIEANEQAQRAQPVKHPDLSGLQSSGEGWLTR